MWGAVARLRLEAQMNSEKGKPDKETIKPTFVRPSANWAEMTSEQKHEWALAFVRAIKDKSEPKK